MKTSFWAVFFSMALVLPYPAYAENPSSLVHVSAFPGGVGSSAFQADLQEIDSNGSPVAAQFSFHLTLNQQEEKAVSFSLSQSPICAPNQACPQFIELTTFFINKKTRIECGAAKYLAFATNALATDHSNPNWLTLIDHSQDHCANIPATPWVVTWYEPNGSVVTLIGTPTAVDNRAPCVSDFQETNCPHIFQPTSCVVRSVNGEDVKRPIKANGANACVAIEMTKTAVCEHGLDADSLLDSEIDCAATPRAGCPILNCPVLPQNCHPVPVQFAHDKTCPVNCGQIVCDGK